MTVRKVLIVGGGIAGLTLAVALRRAGIDAIVAELQPAWRVLGVGISLTGPTLRALGTLGLLDAAVAVSYGYSQMRVFDPSGAQTGAIELPRVNGPAYPAQVAIGRRVLHDVLLAAAEAGGTDIRLGVTVAALEQHNGQVAVHFTDGRTESFDLVVGADGLHSRVRRLVFPDAPEPRFTGLVVWRYTLERFDDVQCMHLAYGAGSKPGLNPVSNDEMFLFLVNKIASDERPPAAELPRMLREQLAGYGGVLARVRERIVDQDACDYRPMETLLLPAPWYRGCVLIIGDAAHTTTPHLATGAGIAIEDAVVLAEELARAGTLGSALERFMQRRFERCRLVVDTALQLGEWEKDPAIPAVAHMKLIGETFAQLAAPI